MNPDELDKNSSKSLAGLQNCLRITASVDSVNFKLALRALKYFAKGMLPICS